MSFFHSIYRNRYRDRDYAPRPAIIEAATRYQEYLRTVKVAWVLGDLVIEFQEKEQLPSRASIALKFLEHCLDGSEGCAPTGCCSSSLQDERVFDEDEKAFKSTSLELLRNWFNGEIELEASVLRRRLRVKQETNRDVAIPLNSERKLK